MCFYIKIKAIIITIVLVILFSCKSNNSTILKIGDFEISEYTFKREMKKYLQTCENDNVNTIIWGEEFINNCFLISDALYLRYDTIEFLKDELDVVSQVMMVQRYGYLWKKTVSPIVDDFMRVTKDKIEKRNKLLFVDIIICDNIDSLKILINNLHIDDMQSFNKLKALCVNKTYLSNRYYSIYWPYGNLYKFENEISLLNPGMISSPLFDESRIIYLYLDHVEEIKINKKDEQNLSSELQMIKEREIDVKKELEMKNTGRLLILEDSLNCVLNYITNNFIGDFNPIIAEYELDNKKKYIDLNSFSNYLKYNPYKRTVRSLDDVKKYINQYFFNLYLSNEASCLGLYESEEFKYDKQYFYYTLLLREYFNNKIINNANVDSSEIASYYENNLSEFEIVNGASINIFTFVDYQSAEKGLKKISCLIDSLLFNEEGLTKFEGLVNYEKNQIINFVNSVYPDNITNSIQNLPERSLSLNIYPFMNKYILIYKNKSVKNFNPEIDFVKDRIYYKLLESKITEVKKTQVQKLKSTLNVDINKTGIIIK